MNPVVGIAAFAAVSLATAVIGFYGLRISRTTGDFYVASRTVRPWWNASAIGGEYLSAASFLGVAGLILLSGTDALWYPGGLHRRLSDVAAVRGGPLRRSGAYTIPDFTEARLDSRAVRRVTSVVVVLVGWLYIVPQLHGAALAIRITTGLPAWVGQVAVVAVVCVTVVSGGMRSITFVQAFQYWLKLTALAVPILFILFVLAGNGAPAVAEAGANPTAAAPASPYQNISLLVALLFGTLGLPHVLVRFYTNPDGHSARRTTLIVLGLLSVFYLFPTAYGLVGRLFAPGLAQSGQADALVLLLPGRMIGGPAGDLLSALVVAGAFAAFLSTTSGLVVSLAGVISQDVLGGSVRGFRLAAVISAVVPLGDRVHDGLFGPGRNGGAGVCLHGLDHLPGAAAGDLVAGPDGRGGDRRDGDRRPAVRRGHGGRVRAGQRGRPSWLAQPAAWTVPAAFAVMVLVSRATKQPGAAGHHPADDPAAHPRKAAGDRPVGRSRSIRAGVSASGSGSVDGGHQLDDAVQEGVHLALLVAVAAHGRPEHGPPDVVHAQRPVLFQVADQLMAQLIDVGGVVAARLGFAGAPEALAVGPVEPSAQQAGQPADLAEPGFLAAFGDQFVAFPQGKRVLQPVQGGVDAGRGVAALDGVERDRTDVGTLHRAGSGARGFERHPCALQELINLLGVVPVLVPLHAVKGSRNLPLNVHCQLCFLQCRSAG